MFLFSKKRLKSSGLFSGMTDSHCHILPGVDDGVQTMEASLAILHQYEELGVSTVWLTPHIMEDVPNETAELRERFAELKAAYDGPLRLHLAAEYMIDNLFYERFANRDLLYHSNPEANANINANAVTVPEVSTEGVKYLLVETSYFNPPMDLWGTLEDIKRAGIFPILAHPERYVYMEEKDYARLREMGVRLQLNLFSLTGHYGKPVQKKAEKLLAKGYYSLLGTDLHRHAQLKRNLECKLSKSHLAALEQIAK